MLEENSICETSVRICRVEVQPWVPDLLDRAWLVIAVPGSGQHMEGLSVGFGVSVLAA